MHWACKFKINEIKTIKHKLTLVKSKFNQNPLQNLYKCKKFDFSRPLLELINTQRSIKNSGNFISSYLIIKKFKPEL